MKPIGNDEAITRAQQEYIEILCVDLQLSRSVRNAMISDKLNRKIDYLDAMLKWEGSQIIQYLKELKENAR